MNAEVVTNWVQEKLRERLETLLVKEYESFADTGMDDEFIDASVKDLADLTDADIRQWVEKGDDEWTEIARSMLAKAAEGYWKDQTAEVLCDHIASELNDEALAQKIVAHLVQRRTGLGLAEELNRSADEWAALAKKVAEDEEQVATAMA